MGISPDCRLSPLKSGLRGNARRCRLWNISHPPRLLKQFRAVPVVQRWIPISRNCHSVSLGAKKGKPLLGISIRLWSSRSQKHGRRIWRSDQLVRDLPKLVLPFPLERAHQPFSPVVPQARLHSLADGFHKPRIRPVQPAISHDELRQFLAGHPASLTDAEHNPRHFAFERRVTGGNGFGLMSSGLISGTTRRSRSTLIQ